MNAADRNQSEKRDERGRFCKGNKPVAGFDVNPQNRSNGRWKKETSFSYQYRRFLSMSFEELKKIADKPDSEKTVVEILALSRILAARKSLADVKEITDRTEGKATQNIDLTSDGEPIGYLIYVPQKNKE
jgi:hypothetical protein